MMDLDDAFYTGRGSAAAVRGVSTALDELFTHSDGVGDAFIQELEELGIQLPKPPYKCVTITPGMQARTFTMSQPRAFYAEMAQQLRKELRLDGLFFYRHCRMQGIVSLQDEAELRELYQELKRILTGESETNGPHAAISNTYSLMEISRGCAENQAAHEFERFLTNRVTVLVQPKDYYLYGAPLPERDDDLYFGTLSQEVCNAMALGDMARTHQILNEALDFIVGQFPRVSAVHMRAIYFCKPLEMALVGADLIDRMFVQRFRLVQRVIEPENEAALRAAFHQALDDIYAYTLQRRQMHNSELLQQVAEYIAQNLSDNMLSIPNLARQFGVPEAKLSAQFRDYYKDSIPNYIHQHRVAQIRQQLRTTDKTVREIALEAGYVSMATMNRAFHRIEGVYPGQYRQKYRRSGEASPNSSIQTNKILR